MFVNKRFIELNIKVEILIKFSGFSDFDSDSSQGNDFQV
jgi:hypothetical protein